MSRCFPFPPPGYEAKARSEHSDLLKKEKHKEKKHKKKRKDRGKGERKEKDQGRRNGKYNNKKHKREKKHKDMRKNKGSDKERRQILEQETQKNDNLGNRRPKETVQNEAVKDSKPTDELVTQITSQEGHANHICSSTSKFPPRSIEYSVVVCSKEEGKTSLNRVAWKSGQIVQGNHASEKGKDSDHGSKTRIHNSKSLQVGSAEKRPTRKHDSRVGLRHATTLAQQNGRSTPSPNALQRIEQVGQHSDGSSHSAYGKFGSMSTNRMMEKEKGSVNNFHTRMDQDLVRGKDGRVQVKAHMKGVKANHHKVVKDSDRDHNVNLKGVKDRDGDPDVKKRKARGKNENKEEKNGVVNELKQKGLDAHEARKNNTHHLMDSAHLNEKFTSDDIRKRKDWEANCSLHAVHNMRMTKLPRASPANIPCLSGESLNHSQGTALHSSTVPVGANTCEKDTLQDMKECYNNGITGSRHLEEHKASISSCSFDFNEVSLAPPHPDTKYLSQVYSVPAVADCSEYIDHDWLFSGGPLHQKTAMLEAESPQVWAEALPIDSADIVALPYVVPL